MSESDRRYVVTVYVAAPGTPLSDGETSMAGHVYYSISNGVEKLSYGFMPVNPGSGTGPGKVSDEDTNLYRDPRYARTLEISKEQYDKLQRFGKNPAAHGFDMQYNGATNSCIDFTWKALNHAGLQRKSRFRIGDGDFDGALKPLENIDDIQSIPAPMPASPLNVERWNAMPEQDWLQKLISETEEARGNEDNFRLATAQPVLTPDNPQHPDHALLEQIRGGVRKLGEERGVPFDDRAERLSRSLLAACREGHGPACNFIRRADHVVVGQDNMFVVQGRLDDPAHLRVHVNVAQAMNTPVEQSDARLQAARHSMAQTQAPAEQPAMTQTHGTDRPRAPVLS